MPGPVAFAAGSVGGDPTEGGVMAGGRRRRGASVKTLKRMLKKAGLKTTGKKAALTRRAKKAHLKMRGAGGETTEEELENPLSALPKTPVDGGRRRRGSRKSRGFKLF